MMRSSVQYRRLNVQDKSENENDISTSDGETTKDNIPNDDFVDYVGADGIRFVPNNTKKKKKLGQWVPEQFLLPKRKVPWKSISYAVLLFVMGTVLLISGCLIHIGHVDNEKYGDRLWPLIIFGLLMFIPGSYHVYLVMNVFFGNPGYTFDDFPQFED